MLTSFEFSAFVRLILREGTTGLELRPFARASFMCSQCTKIPAEDLKESELYLMHCALFNL